MKYLKHTPAILLGLGMLFFGFQKFVPLLPAPDPSTFSPGMLAFFSGMVASGYFIFFLGGAEMLGGLLVLLPRTRALGALVLAPITLNIVVYHLFTSPEGTAPGLVFLLLNAVVLFQHKPSFAGVLKGDETSSFKRFQSLLSMLLGVLMVVFGLNKYFHYLEDFSLRPSAQAFWDGLVNSGYFFEWLGAVEALAGVLLLIPRTRIIGALVLFPIALNILVFHLFLAPEAIVFGLAVFLLTSLVLWDHRRALLPLVRVAKPQ